MIRVYIFCEGQTEETFVRDVLQQYFNNRNIALYSILVRTSKNNKGGVSSYGKIKHQIEKKCKEDKEAWVTTLFDYYGFPNNFNIDKKMTSFDRAQLIEKAFLDDISQNNFIPNLMIHEFEGLLFSLPHTFNFWFEPETVNNLESIKNAFDSPEHINDGIETAPSKRILNICKGYDKILHGPLIASEIGLDIIRKECRSFNKWLERIENLA